MLMDELMRIQRVAMVRRRVVLAKIGKETSGRAMEMEEYSFAIWSKTHLALEPAIQCGKFLIQ